MSNMITRTQAVRNTICMYCLKSIAIGEWVAIIPEAEGAPEFYLHWNCWESKLLPIAAEERAATRPAGDNPYAAINKNPAKPLAELFAIVADVDGGEGIVALLSPAGAWMPLVGGDAERMRSVISAAGAALKPGEFKVLRFTTRTDVTGEFS